MEYTKKDIAFTILKAVGGFSDDSDTDIREIYFYIDTIGDKLRFDVISAGLTGGVLDISSYLKTYKNVDTTLDADLDLYYSDLPVSVISLPYGKGIWAISPMKDQNSGYIPRRSAAVQLTSGTDWSRMQGRVSFWKEEQKAFYSIKPVDKVLMKLIPIGKNIDESDVYPAPDNIVAIIVEAVIKTLQSKAPVDYLNDSNPAPNVQ